MTENKPVVLVAGDVCLDVVGIQKPPDPSALDKNDNWRLTGEICTHYFPGGAFLLAEFIRASDSNLTVMAPTPCQPRALTCEGPPDQPIQSMAEFLQIAERLTRNEIVHSLLHLGLFKGAPGSRKPDTIRVFENQGFAGPKDSDPSMKILPPVDPEGAARVVVLDDTGNQFRRSIDQWPEMITRKPTSEISPVVVYKLHRPLPDGKRENLLWDTVMANHADRCIVTISVDDLRENDAPISRGLSWERTALDLVWQLLNVDAFKPLRDCKNLIVRMGLDGALYWHNATTKDDDKPRHYAWLIYDPAGIEGTGTSAYEGKMAGYGSAFTAALVHHLLKTPPQDCFDINFDSKENPVLPKPIEDGIKKGLAISRRLLAIGFGKVKNQPQYPTHELFTDTGHDTPFFACQPVPIIPGTAIPDRGYWRLLEAIFKDNTSQLQRAVTMTATGAKPASSEDKEASDLLKQVPVAVFGNALKAIDRREVENYRALYSLLRDYVSKPNAPRPLSVAVFGPPGAGKSFGVKMVAKALGEIGGQRPIVSLTFNLSQYRKADDLADAFHLVRDCVLSGKIPLVFFDEFDTSLDGIPLGWLRYFLAPMQDGEFLDRGTPHPIGQSVFVFAGGTCNSYAEFAHPFIAECQAEEEKRKREEFQKAKGPDFLSRLRATLDIPGLDLQSVFDPFGPVDALPSEPAILLRRANILAFQLSEKAQQMRDARGEFRVSESVLRTLLHLPRFVHGNRSFEAILDMSHFLGAGKFTPALLPASCHTALHANANHLAQLLATDFPFPPGERELIAQEIHRIYVEQRKCDPKHNPKDPALRDWDDLAKDDLGRSYQRSNLEQADHIAIKLRSVGLWFRKKMPGVPEDPNIGNLLETKLELLARLEHNRWVVEKRKAGWIPAPDTSRESRNNYYRLHNALFPWEKLTDELKELDFEPVRKIPHILAKADYEIIQVDVCD